MITAILIVYQICGDCCQQYLQIVFCIKMQESQNDNQIQFTLKSIFIVHPTAHAKYKIKIVIHQLPQETQINHNSKCTFKVNPINYYKQEDSFGYICLMEKIEKSDSKDFLQVGRGKIECESIVMGRPELKQMVKNGIIYGTRVYNYDRIIAKYGYSLAFKMDGKLQKQRHKFHFLNMNRKQKLPKFQIKPSVLQRNQMINSRIQKLTNQMNSIIGQENEESQSESYKNNTTDKEVYVQPNWQFKYEENFIKLINQQQNKQLQKLSFKKIKIMNNCKKQKQCLMVLYQAGHQQKMSKIVEICLSLKFDADNTFQQDKYIYLPKTNSSILIQIHQLSKISSIPQFSAKIMSSYSKNKIIDVFDSQGQEKGFIIAQTQTVQQIDTNHLNNYAEQSKVLYNKINNKNIGNDCIFKKYSIKIKQKECQTNKSAFTSIGREDQRTRRRLTSFKSAAASSMTRKSKTIQNQFEDHSKTLKKQKPRVDYSPFSQKKFNLSQSKKQTEPKMNQFSSKLNQKFPLILKIQSIYLNIYDRLDEEYSNIWLCFVINDQKIFKNVVFGSNWLKQQKKSIMIQLRDNNQIINIVCLASNPQVQSIKIGNCNVISRQFIAQSNTKSLRTFLYSNSKIVGMIIFEFRFIYKTGEHHYLATHKFSLNNIVCASQRQSLVSDQQYQLTLKDDQINFDKVPIYNYKIREENTVQNGSEASELLTQQNYSNYQPFSGQI